MIFALMLPTIMSKSIALLFAFPPLVWGSYELGKRRAAVILGRKQCTVRRPLQLRSISIPYEHIAGVVPWPGPDRLSIVYYKPRPAFDGADTPRPPRIKVVQTEALEQTAQAFDVLQQRTAQSSHDAEHCPLLPEKALIQRLQRHRFRRVSRNLAVILLMPLAVMVTIQVVFTVVRILT